MYCPNDECPDYVACGIRGEYRDGLTTCPRCNATLLPGSPPVSAEPEFTGADRLVPIASFEYEHQANVAISFLAANGIAAIVASDDCGRTNPILGIVTGGVRVMVHESQAREAIDLLTSGEAEGNVGDV